MSENKEDSAAEKKVTVAEVKKSVDDLWGAFKRLQKVCEIHFGVDVNKDGKKGSVRVASLIVILFATLAFATSDIVVWYSSDATKGTAKITSDDAGAATLTVDKLAVTTIVGGGVVTNIGPTVTGGTFTRGTNVATVSSGGTATGVTNVNQVATAGTFAGGTATGMTNVNQVATAGTFAGGTATGMTNVNPVVSGTLAGAAATFSTTLGVTGETTLKGKYAVVGGDATTGLMVQSGTFTNGQATVTFGAAFKASTTPVVICGWTQDGSTLLGTNCAIFATSIVSNQFVPKTEVSVTTLALTNANYIAIGTRP